MGARALIIDKAICYGKDNTNGACNQRGSCVAPNRCSCHTGYTGSQCEKCLDARADPEHFIWWHTNSHPDCALTCSWKNQWCWPGDCPDRRLRTSCKCRNGFVKHDGGSRYTKCDLVEKPQLLTCHIGMTDAHHSVRSSTHGSHSGCQYESDTYVNLNPI
ncbi:protein disulfide isomerase crld-1-like isoform X1 [Haliotis rufescens]|uniref:protein disulfide isomerase crld-1-like isoform X1 n=1 Tax=Haliotis rufescens TaxID=6454 RepID=UPI00201F569A|nr:protein disulfide isomerase crld-1-like isoform X1 [Haliotis rufescens]